jgi:uncharacterized protein YutD
VEFLQNFCVGGISAKISALWNFCKISGLVEYLQNFCVGGISAKFLGWWNFCKISALVEYLQNFCVGGISAEFLLHSAEILSNSTNAEILQNFTKNIKIKKNIIIIISI